MNKKILVITDNTPQQINGVVTTFSHIEKYARLNGYWYYSIDPTHFVSYSAPGYPEVRLSIPKDIGKHIENINPDFIHIATEGPVGLAARMWLDRKGYKYNTSYHTKFPEFLNKLYYVPEGLTYAYLRWFHKHSGKVLINTDTMARELREHKFKQNLVTWTRGANPVLFNPHWRIRSSDKKILLSVGRVSKEKNLDAFCSLNIPNTIKIVVGDGPYLNTLKEKYPDVQFVGMKIGDELAQHYANADVFVFSSKADTFGIVMIESISCGTPIAGYPVPGPIDIVQPSRNGYLSENLEEAVKKCLDLDREVVYNSSKKWTWQNCWKIFEDNLIPIR